MDPKEYLNQIKFTGQEIRSRIEERDQLRQSIEIKTTSFKADKVQEGGSSYFDDKYVKYVEVSETINDKIDTLVDLKMQVSTEIDLLDKAEHRIILRLKYINLNTFEQIAVKTHYDIRTVHRLHGNALKAFGERVTKCHGMS